MSDLAGSDPCTCCPIIFRLVWCGDCTGLVFAASINPTYTYGKVQEDSGASSTSSGDFVHPAQRIVRVCVPVLHARG